jgi:hypothetical protein
VPSALTKQLREDDKQVPPLPSSHPHQTFLASTCGINRSSDFAVACQRPNLSNYGTKFHVADINPGWAVIKIGAQITGGSKKAKQSVLIHSHDS